MLSLLSYRGFCMCYDLEREIIDLDFLMSSVVALGQALGYLISPPWIPLQGLFVGIGNLLVYVLKIIRKKPWLETVKTEECHISRADPPSASPAILCTITWRTAYLYLHCIVLKDLCQRIELILMGRAGTDRSGSCVNPTAHLNVSCFLCKAILIYLITCMPINYELKGSI